MGRNRDEVRDEGHREGGEHRGLVICVMGMALLSEMESYWEGLSREVTGSDFHFTRIILAALLRTNREGRGKAIAIERFLK